MPRRTRSAVFAAVLAAAAGQAQAMGSVFLGDPLSHRGQAARWDDAVARHEAIGRRAEDDCRKGAAVSCAHVMWRTWAEGLRAAALPPRVLAERVNREVNDVAYAADDSTWGIGDYWATPAEVFNGSAADCEDYAFAKYMTLRALGVGDADMRVVVLKDASSGGWHAVLVVRADGEELLLDNAVRAVVPTASAPQYAPVWAVNLAGAWAVGEWPPPGADDRGAAGADAR